MDFASIHDCCHIPDTIFLTNFNRRFKVTKDFPNQKI